MAFVMFNMRYFNVNMYFRAIDKMQVFQENVYIDEDNYTATNV